MFVAESKQMMLVMFEVKSYAWIKQKGLVEDVEAS